MNLTFIGMPGAGKTTRGKKAAQRLGYKFVDIDKKLEQKYKLKLRQIIDKLGEKEFIRTEARTVLSLGKIINSVIAPGGSVIYSPQAMTFLKKNTLIIFLDAPFSLIKKQVGNLKRRGVIGAKTKNLRKIYQERLPLYRKYADIIINLKKKNE